MLPPQHCCIPFEQLLIFSCVINKKVIPILNVNLSLILVIVEEVKLPPKMKVRGRPKGVDMTAIGLPKRRKLNSKKPTLFIHKSATEKAECKYHNNMSPAKKSYV